MACAQHPPQLGIARAAPVKVGAERDQDERSTARIAHRGDERVGERRPLVLVAAGGEQLLELVDRDHEPPLGRCLCHRLLEGLQRVSARARQRDRPAAAARQHALGERGQQAGAQRRGLAAAGGPDDAQQRAARDARDHLGDEALAAEENVGVVDVEAGEALERAGPCVLWRLGTLVSRLELDDARGQVVLGRPQPRAVAGRPVRGGAEAPPGLLVRPAASFRVHAPGDSAALLRQALDRRLLAVLAGDRLDVGARQRPERHRRTCAVLRRREHEQRPVAQGHALELGGDLAGRVPEVVDHEQRRAPRGPRPLDDLARRLRRPGAGRVEHVPAVALHLGRELGGQAGLADPGDAGDQELGAVAGAGAAPVLAQPVELGRAPDERRARLELVRQLGGYRRVKRRVLPQDRLVQAAQLGAGLDADRVDELVARPAVGAEGVGLAAALVEREHEQAVEVLAQRLVSQQRLDLVDHLGVAAGREILLERQLGRGEAELLQAADLQAGERLSGDIVEGWSTPEGQRLARHPLGDEPLEAARIDLARAEPQLVAVAAGDDLRAVARPLERLAELRHVDLHHLRRGCRGRVAPEAVDQRLGRDGRALAERQHGEQRPRLPCADRDRVVIDARLHGSENSKVHS